MKLTIPSFESAHVLVAGDVMLDRYWHGNTSRISPEAPVPVVHIGDAEERPGGSGNVALNIASLGAQAIVLGLTGDDEAADALTHKLEVPGVQCLFERLPGSSTVTKLRVVSRHQQLIRLDFEDGFSHYDGKGLLKNFEKHLAGVGAVVLSDYGKGAMENISEFIAAARMVNTPVLVDPKGTDFKRYAGATLITPNLSEFEAIVGHCSTDEEMEIRGERLRKELKLDALLITRSERGMLLIQESEPPFELPTKAREVYDVTGAGDTVISVLAASLAAGQSMADATALANLAAGVVVGKLGTATVTVTELRRAMREQAEVERGVVDEVQLHTIVQEAKAHGERIVMTNGCFDILHAGHVTYLAKARELGDRLIVAVNDDASVKKLKGEGRPVNNLKQRMAVLAGLESVDWVVPFSEETPERLICEVLPDTLVKGGDYRTDEIAGNQCVADNGGKTVVLEYIDGCSTTRVIESIQHKAEKHSSD